MTADTAWKNEKYRWLTDENWRSECHISRILIFCKTNSSGSAVSDAKTAHHGLQLCVSSFGEIGPARSCYKTAHKYVCERQQRRITHKSRRGEARISFTLLPSPAHDYPHRKSNTTASPRQQSRGGEKARVPHAPTCTVASALLAPHGWENTNSTRGRAGWSSTRER